MRNACVARPISDPFAALSFSPQALFTLMEKDIKVSGRPKDQALLKKATEQAAADFKEQAGFEVKTEVDDQLGDKSCVLVSPHSAFCGGSHALVQREARCCLAPCAS